VCRAFEEYGREKAEEAKAEARKEERTSFAKRLLQDGSMTLEHIADIANLPLEQVQQLAEQIKL
jgi:predicted transposase YdaD